MKTAFIFLLIGLASCDLLTTRDSEEPTTSGNNIIPATTPDILFNNFKASLEDKILENYLASFVDGSFLKKSFKYFPSAGSNSQYPALNNWSIESERQYFRNLKSISSQGKSITLSLFNSSNTTFGDSAIYQFEYKLTLVASDQSISGDYTGNTQFKIYLDSRNQWVIVEWNDFRKNNSKSWSDLKGRLY